jgi:hypothetical protein
MRRRGRKASVGIIIKINCVHFRFFLYSNELMKTGTRQLKEHKHKINFNIPDIHISSSLRLDSVSSQVFSLGGDSVEG